MSASCSGTPAFSMFSVTSDCTTMFARCCCCCLLRSAGRGRGFPPPCVCSPSNAFVFSAFLIWLLQREHPMKFVALDPCSSDGRYSMLK